MNVGTATIVEFLQNSGFEIENKPTAKISEEMEAALYKEFSKSLDVKKKADEIVIGTRPTTPAVKKEPVKEPSLFSSPATETLVEEKAPTPE
ncbi:MAG: hypothetical protein D6765_07510, partial [Bacteroidetes bacterium]